MKKILLIDGNSIVHRAYYGNKQDLKTTTNIPTNALHTFINTFLNLIPNYYDIFVAFDISKKTFRHEKYKDYKGKRGETPNDLREQFPLVKEFLDKAKVKYFQVEKYEADDIIGTLVKKLKDKYIIHILSSDKDMYQLIDTNVFILNPKNYQEINIDKLYEKMQLKPNQIIDFKALSGDSSDNLIGVKGIGEVMAKKLLQEYETLDNIYKNLNSIKEIVKQKLIAGKDLAYLTRDLATIYNNIDLDIKVSNYNFDKYNVEEFLTKYELKSIKSKLKFDDKQLENIEIDESIKIIKCWDRKYEDDLNYLYLECLIENYHSDQILGVGIFNKNGSFYYDLKNSKNIDNLFQEFLLSNKKIKTYDIKKTIYCLNRLNYKVNYSCFVDDLMIALYILDSNISPNIYNQALNLFNIDLLNLNDFLNKQTKNILDIKDKLLEKCIINRAKFIYDFENIIFEKLKKYNQWNLYKYIDLPFAFVLLDIEKNGVLIDINQLHEQIEKNKKIKQELEQKIIVYANQYGLLNFNPASSKQVSILLYEKLNLNNKFKNSTKREALEELVYDHKIVDLLIQYRSIQKLYSTYLIGLKKYLDKDNLIHSIFSQVSTNTGRLNSTNPNLQNICVRSNNQKEVRKIFIAKKDKLLISFDYSQIELRVFGIVANEQNLIKIFQQNGDVHTEAAKKIFKTDIVDQNQRRMAKIFNFGILYGLTIQGLAKDLKIDRKKAKEFINKYFETFDQILPFKDMILNQVKTNGYVQTLTNRRRYINILNCNKKDQEQLFRQAFNMPIQGSAADIIKVAMNNIYKKYQNKDVKMIAQIHDEVIFEVDTNLDIDLIFNDLKNIMINACYSLIDIVKSNKEINIKMEVNGSIGKNWFELK